MCVPQLQTPFSILQYREERVREESGTFALLEVTLAVGPARKFVELEQSGHGYSLVTRWLRAARLLSDSPLSNIQLVTYSPQAYFVDLNSGLLFLNVKG